MSEAPATQPPAPTTTLGRWEANVIKARDWFNDPERSLTGVDSALADVFCLADRELDRMKSIGSQPFAPRRAAPPAPALNREQVAKIIASSDLATNPDVIGHAHILEASEQLADAILAALDVPTATASTDAETVQPLHLGAASSAPVPANEPQPENRGRHSTHPCERCGAMEVYVKMNDDDCDSRVTCYACHRSYMVDGIDS